MTKRAAIMTVLVGLTLVTFAAGAELGLLRPLSLPGVSAPVLAEPQARPMTRDELEALLARVGKSLSPELRSRLAEAILSESARAGYDPLFVLAVVSVESSFRARVSSDRGALGLMQLTPSTFAWISGREPDIGADDAAVAEDPVLDVRLAIRYFHWLEKRFISRDDALMAYNAGPAKLQKYKRAEEIPESLREYPRKVMREYQRFVQLAVTGIDSQHLLLARAN